MAEYDKKDFTAALRRRAKQREKKLAENQAQFLKERQLLKQSPVKMAESNVFQGKTPNIEVKPGKTNKINTRDIQPQLSSEEFTDKLNKKKNVRSLRKAALGETSDLTKKEALSSARKMVEKYKDTDPKKYKQLTNKLDEIEMLPSMKGAKAVSKGAKVASKTAKGLSKVSKSAARKIPVLGAILGLAAGLDPAHAAADTIVPGGLDNLGELPRGSIGDMMENPHRYSKEEMKRYHEYMMRREALKNKRR